MVIEAATDRDLDDVRRLLHRHQLPRLHAVGRLHMDLVCAYQVHCANLLD